MKRTRVARISAFILISFMCTSVCNPLLVEAHVGIPSSPTTSCGSIDSTDLTTHAGNQIDSRIATASAFSTSGKLYSVEGDSTTPTGATTTPWTRNTSSWTSEGSDLDFTGVNAWTQMYNGYSGRYQHKATLISPRHFVTAHHWGVSPGSTLAFVTNTNQIVYRTVQNTAQVGSTDIEVGVLDSDVPDSVTYYPVVASTTLDTLLYKFVPPQTLDVPIVAFNQFEESFLLKMTGLDGYGIGFTKYFGSDNRALFSKYPVPGDSGSPLFMIIDNRPVLLTTFTSANSGANLGAYISQINSTISTLGNSNGYTVTEYNPTCFTQYTPNHIPVFTNSTATTTRVHYSGSTNIFTFAATDADSDTLTYSLESLSSVSSSTLALTASDYFSINSSSGVLSQTADLNNLTLGDKVALTVKVVDNRSPQASAYSTTTITIDHPVVTNASRKNSVIEITYDRSLATTSVPATSDFVVKVNGSNRSVSAVSVFGRAVQLTLSSAASSGDSITLAYTPGTNKIKDTLGSFAPQILASSPLVVSNSRAGNVDTSFDPGTGFNNTPNAVVVDANGDVYVGGDFTQYNGNTTNHIVRLNADGTVDTSFNTGTGFGTGIGVTVRDISVQSNGKVLVAGSFASYNGTPAKGIVRVNTDGSIDSTFNNGGAGINVSGGGSTYVSDIDIHSDGKIVIVGQFTQYNGTTRYGVARLNSDGSLDVSFVPATLVGDFGNIRAIDIQSDGKVLLGGSFASIGGVARNYFARLTTTGALDTSFVPPASFPNYTNDVYSIKELSNGNVLVSGAMSYANANWSMALFDSAANSLSYFNTDPLMTESDLITAVNQQQSGKILAASGAFVYGSNVYKRIVRFNESGSIDETFEVTSISDDVFGVIDYDIAFDANDDIYLVGPFGDYTGVSRSGIVKLFGNTQADITAPTVSNITSTQSDGRVGQGITVPIQVTFSEAVTVTGTPTLALSVGTTTRSATYTSGSGSSTLTFSYTVQDGDQASDLEYTNTNALSLAGGTITDSASNTAVLTLPVPQTTGSLGFSKSIAVDGVLPVLFASSVDGSTITLIYNENLNTTLPSASDFAVVKNGATSLSISSITVSSTTVTLNLSSALVPSDSLTLAYTPVTNPLQDLFGNQVPGFSAMNVLNTTVDSFGPAVSSIATTNVTTSGATITWNTDESADTQVEYGLSSTYTASSTYSGTLSTGHSVTLSGLSAGTTYHFRVVSADSLGNKTYGSDNTFTTTSVSSGGGGGGSSGGGGGIVIYATTPATTKVGTSTTLSLGQPTLTVKQVQQYLNTHGFPIAVTGPGSFGKETNTLGPLTKTALLKFQKALSLPQTGTLNPQTLLYITQMTTRATTSTTTPQLLCSVPLYLTKPIQYGAKNNPKDVKLLETFLNEFEGFKLTVDGVYGVKDRQAVITWQEKNKDTILTPWGLTRGTGYVFTTSLEKIKQVVEAGCK